MRSVTIVLAVAAVLALSGSAWAASTYTWDNDGGAGDGKWVTPTNWNLTEGAGNADGLPHYKYPGNTWCGDTAIIGSADNSYTVTFGGSDWGDCGPLQLHQNSTVNQTGGTGKSFAADIYGTYNLSGGIYTGVSNFDIRGTFNLSGGELHDGGKILMYSGMVNQTGGKGICGTLGFWGGKYKISNGPLTATSAYFKGSTSSVFHVIGGLSSEITIKNDFNDEKGCTIIAEINSTGLTTISIIDATPGNLTDKNGDIIFHADSVIDVDNAGAAYDTYTVMSWEGSVTGTPTVDLPNTTDWSWNSGTFVGDKAIEVTYVPEPATMVLLGIGGLGVLLRRKNRS